LFFYFETPILAQHLR